MLELREVVRKGIVVLRNSKMVHGLRGLPLQLGGIMSLRLETCPECQPLGPDHVVFLKGVGPDHLVCLNGLDQIIGYCAELLVEPGIFALISKQVLGLRLDVLTF